jgi:hypothetical protein
MEERYNLFSCAHQVRMPTIKRVFVNRVYNRRNTNNVFY